MTSTPPYAALETAWKALLSPLISLPSVITAGNNIYLSDTNVIALHPCLKITTPYYEENDTIAPGCGVFVARSVLSLEMKASNDQTTPVGGQAAFETIVQALYYGPNPTLQTLATRLTATNPTAFYCHGLVGQKTTERTNPMEKLWIKEISFEKVHFMNRANS